MIWNDVLNEACHILGWHNFLLAACVCFSCILLWFIQIIGKWHEHMYVKICWSEHVYCFWVICSRNTYIMIIMSFYSLYACLNEWWMIALIIHYHPDLLFDHACILRWYKWLCVGFLNKLCIHRKDFDLVIIECVSID